MVERTLLRDVSKYETKLLLGFTTRQLVCLVPGLALGIGGYFLTKNALGETALLVGILLALPFLLCGWVKPYGIPLEKYIRSVFVSVVIAPAKRKYKSDNPYGVELGPQTAPKKKKKCHAKNIKSV